MAVQYAEENGSVIMTEYSCFDIEDILESGQFFRFYRNGDKAYTIVAFGKVLHIRQDTEKAQVHFYPCTAMEFQEIWINFFDLERDYSIIKAHVVSRDPDLKTAVDFAGGIRILNQEPWECLVSFIISQNKSIPMIKQVVENLSKHYGNAVGEVHYAFPGPEALAGLTVEEIMVSKAGFRAKYILDAANKVMEKEIEPDRFHLYPTEKLREKLMSIYGVGQKVADCVLLFACGRQEVFPTDVWVKRVMETYYFDTVETNIKEIHNLAVEKWGNYAGFAQQYLFHFARQQKIGRKK